MLESPKSILSLSLRILRGWLPSSSAIFSNKKSQTLLYSLLIVFIITISVFSVLIIAQDVGLLDLTPSNLGQVIVGNSSMINNTIINLYATSNLTYPTIASATNFKVYFKNNTNIDSAVRFEKDGYYFTYDLSGGQMLWRATPTQSQASSTLGSGYSSNTQNTIINVKGNKATYSNAYSFTNVTYDLYNNMLKEKFILSNISSGIKNYLYLEYSGNIKFSKELTICANNVCYVPSGTIDDFNTTGQIDFRDDNGTTRFFLSPPTIVDSAGNKATGMYVVHGSNAQMNFYLRIPTSFLKTAVYPIFIDPSIETEVYQDVKTISYSSDFFNANITLLKNVSESWQNQVESIFVFVNENSYKFGANDSNNNGTEFYKYIVQSDAQLYKEDNKVYVLGSAKCSGNQEYCSHETHEFNFDDICLKVNANCNFNLYNQDGFSYAEVTFYSGSNIDPLINLGESGTYTNSYLTNITYENNFTHLNMSTDFPILFYMPFDVNASTTKTYDYSKNNYDGTFTAGQVIYTPNGLFGSAYNFDGVAEHVITYPTIASTYNWTVSLWVKPVQNIAGGGVFQYSPSSGNRNAIGYNSSGAIQTVTYNGTNYFGKAGPYLSLNEWHHIVMTVDNIATNHLYVDNVEYTSTLSNLDQSANIGLFRIGTYKNGQNSFNGTMDEVLFINRSLDSTEINTLYNNQSSRFMSSGTQLTKFQNFSQDGTSVSVQVIGTEQNLFGSSLNATLWSWNNNSATSYITNDPNLVAYYPLEDANDKVGLYNGTLIGTVTSQQTQFASGYKFRGLASSSDVIAIPPSANFDAMETSGNNFTINLWMKLDSTKCGGAGVCYAIARTLTSTAASNAWAIGYQESTGRTVIDMTGVSTNYPGNVLTAGNWYMMTVIYKSGSRYDFYVNGVAYTGAAQATLPNGTNRQITIGAANRTGVYYWDGFNGTIDEVSLWNRALTTAEIKSLYLTGNQYYNLTGVGLNWTISTSGNQDFSNGNAIFNISNQDTLAMTQFNFFAGTNNFYTPNIIGNITYNVNNGDYVFPSFSNFQDNNGTESSTSLFNVTVANTNGTVILWINGTSILATNLTANVYNASYGSGMFTYNWSAYGNGTMKNLNWSNTVYFTSDDLQPLVSFTSQTPSDGANQSNTDIFINVTATDTFSPASAFIDYDNSLQRWYRMDESNSTAIFDYFGRANGTFTGGVTVGYGNGKFRNALILDGTSGYVSFGTNVNNFTTKTQTIVFWINPAISGQGSKRIYALPSSYYYPYTIAMLAGGIVFRDAGSGTGRTITNVLPANTWTQIAIVTNGNSTVSDMYYNGVLSNNGTETNTWTAPTSAAIGALPGVGQYFNGSLDNFKIFNRSLSASEIAGLYASDLSNSVSNNFTNQSVGTHTITAYAQDIYGNVNSTSRTINILDVSTPTIDFVSPTSNGTQTSTDILVNITSTDNNNYMSQFVDYDNSLYRWWRFDDQNSSGGLVDYFGKTNGTLLNGAYTTSNISGKFGKAGFFDGNNDYVELSPVGVNLNGSMTISAWIKSSAVTGCILSKSRINGCFGTAVQKQWELGFLSGTMYFQIGNGTTVTALSTSTGTTNNGQWHLVTATWDGTKNANGMKLYYDGNNVANQTATISFLNTVPAYLEISQAANYHFNGNIDDVIIFNRSLSASEVQGLYGGTSPRYLYVNYSSQALGNHTFKGYVQDGGGNINTTETRNVSIIVGDTTYPIFSNEWSNNGTLIGSGYAQFNNTVTNTNGTVLLWINGTSYQATNLTANVYNVTIFLTNGTYMYNWTAYGNGTSHLLNNSINRYYTVLKNQIGIAWSYPTSNLNITQNQMFNVSFNVTCTGTNCGATNITLVEDFYYHFVRPNYQEATIDCITPNVCLKRDDAGGGIYNSVTEAYYNEDMTDTSPHDTEWAYGTCANPTLPYSPWSTWIGGSPLNTINLSACVHLISDNIYIDIKFDWWQKGAGGGVSQGSGFSYYRERLTNGVVSDNVGVVSTTSTSPFYTNGSNPINITLGTGESQIVTFWLNATGTLDSAHYLHAYVNLTSNPSVSNSTTNLSFTIRSGCISNMQNTTWSGWSNTTCSSNQMNQSRYFIEYDSNNCGFVNVTHYEYQLVGPTYQNTTWSNWNNIGCVFGDIMNQSRNLTQFDVYGCGTNTTFYEYRTNGYCKYDLINPNATLTFPINNTITKTDQNYTANLSDNIGIKNSTLTIFNSSNDVINQTTTSYTVGTLTTTVGVVVSLVDGVYKWMYSLFDWSGNNYATENNTITIDKTLPSIRIVYPSNATYSINVSELNYTYSDMNSGSCWYSNNSGIWNSTSQPAGTNFTSITSIEGSNTWTIYCNDTASNVNITSITFFKDTIYPTIDYGDGTAVDGANLSQSNIYINTTWTELNFGNITFTIRNLTAEVNSTTFTSATYLINFTNLPNTDYTYWVNITDSSGNKNSTAIRRIRIDNVNPVVVSQSPSNNTYSNTDKNYTVNITDNVGIKNATLTITNSTGDIVNQTTFINSLNNIVTQSIGVVVTLVDDVYHWWYDIFDWSGNHVTSNNNTITIDTIAPTIDITYPLNTTYNITVIDLLFTHNDVNTHTCWYSTNGGSTNISNPSCANVYPTSNQGSNTWLVGINDSAGNTNSSIVTFFVDSISPVVIYASNSDSDGINVSRSNIFVNVTVVETNFANITFILRNLTDVVNTTTYLTTTYFVNWTNLPDTDYTYNVTVIDILNNYGYASNRTIRLDTNNPNATLNTPANNNISFTANQNYTVNITDNLGIKNATLTIKTIGGTTINTTNYNFPTNTITSTIGIVVTMTEGAFKWFYSIWDWAGNTFTTDERNITIDLYTPQVQYVNPTYNGTYEGNSILINITASDTNLAYITSYLYNSSGLIYTNYSASNNLYLSFIGLPSGNYYINASANDTYGKINWTETRTISLAADITPPNLTIYSPTNTSYDVEYFLINVSSTDMSPPLTYWYSLDGDPNVTFTSPKTLFNVGWNYNHTIIIYVNDSFGNIAKESRTFFIGGGTGTTTTITTTGGNGVGPFVIITTTPNATTAPFNYTITLFGMDVYTDTPWTAGKNNNIRIRTYGINNRSTDVMKLDINSITNISNVSFTISNFIRNGVGDYSGNINTDYIGDLSINITSSQKEKYVTKILLITINEPSVYEKTINSITNFLYPALIATYNFLLLYWIYILVIILLFVVLELTYLYRKR